MPDGQELAIEILLDRPQIEAEIFIATHHDCLQHLHRQRIVARLSAFQLEAVVQAIGAERFDVLSRTVLERTTLDAVLDFFKSIDGHRPDDLHQVHPRHNESCVLGAILAELLLEVLVDRVAQTLLGAMDVGVIALITELELCLLHVLGFTCCAAGMVDQDRDHLGRVVRIWWAGNGVHTTHLEVLLDFSLKDENVALSAELRRDSQRGVTLVLDGTAD